MTQPHIRAADEAPEILYVSATGDCSAASTAAYLNSLGMLMSTVSTSQLGQSTGVQLGSVSVVLLGEQVLSDAPAIEQLATMMNSTPLERLFIVFAADTLTFDQRLALSRLGNVRIFPAAGAHTAVRDLIREWRRDRSMSGYRVLLVEDSRTDAYLATSYMQQIGIEVMHIRSAERVLDAIREHQPDLIVSDLHMPGCEGDQMARVIRQDSQATMPIIFLSSEANSEKQLLALAAGADGFIRKPLIREPFIQALKSTIRRAVALDNKLRRDPLTNLLNRAQFDLSMRRCAGSDEECVIAILDIDHFKSVNDTYGHPVGDTVICELATLLENGTRSTDYVGRVGGEEFAVLLPSCSLQNASAILHRLRTRFEKIVFRADAGSFTCSFSAGMTQLGKDPASAYRDADAALYLSKKMGRNRVTVCPQVPTMSVV